VRAAVARQPCQHLALPVFPGGGCPGGGAVTPLSAVSVCISLLTNDESSVFLSVLIGQMNLFSVEMPFLIFGEFFLKMKVLS